MWIEEESWALYRPQIQSTSKAIEGFRSVKRKEMALVPTSVSGAVLDNNGPIFAEVEMGADSSASTVRATVVQASTIFYDTPATLGIPSSFLLPISACLDYKY